jgi:hypothetical protein
MKTNLLCGLLFAFCFVLPPARAADQAPAPSTAEKPASVAPTDLHLPTNPNPLIDPLTGTEYIAVHNGDIVESVIFITEFEHAHPNERAVLLLPGNSGYLDNRGDAVAFSWEGRVFIHSYRIGNVPVPGVLPAQMDDYNARLHNTFMKLVQYCTKKYCEKLNIHFPVSRDRGVQMERVDALPHLFPNELPGDTDEIQTRRAVARLKKLGLADAIVRHLSGQYPKHYNDITGNLEGGDKYDYNQVVFTFKDFVFGWAPSGDRYLGLAAKTYLPSMIDSIIFSIDYQKANPSEKVFCFLHEASNQDPHSPGDMVSTTVYTKNDQLWFHHLEPGDLPCSLSLDDLKDRDKVIKADLEAYVPAIKKFETEDSQLRHQAPEGLKSYLNGYKAPDITVSGVLAELKKRGVEARVAGNTDSPELYFVWGKQPYTYIPKMGCFEFKSGQVTASN